MRDVRSSQVDESCRRDSRTDEMKRDEVYFQRVCRKRLRMCAEMLS